MLFHVSSNYDWRRLIPCITCLIYFNKYFQQCQVIKLLLIIHFNIVPIHSLSLSLIHLVSFDSLIFHRQTSLFNFKKVEQIFIWSRFHLLKITEMYAFHSFSLVLSPHVSVCDVKLFIADGEVNNFMVFFSLPLSFAPPCRSYLSMVHSFVHSFVHSVDFVVRSVLRFIFF